MSLRSALAEGRRRKLDTVAIGHDDIAFLQYTGRHDRRGQGRDAAAPQHRRQPAAGGRLGPAVPRRAGARRHHAAAALSHLFADGELPDVHDAGRRERADHQPARHPGLRQGTGPAPLHRVHRRQYAVQRAAQQRRFPQARFLAAANDAGRRHGGAEGGGRALAGGDRQAADRGLRPDRNLAGGDDQSARSAAIQRLDRPAGAVDRHRAARRRRPRGTAGQARRDLRQGPAGDGRLLAPARRDGQGHRRPTAGSPPATSA